MRARVSDFFFLINQQVCGNLLSIPPIITINALFFYDPSYMSYVHYYIIQYVFKIVHNIVQHKMDNFQKWCLFIHVLSQDISWFLFKLFIENIYVKCLPIADTIFHYMIIFTDLKILNH